MLKRYAPAPFGGVQESETGDLFKVADVEAELLGFLKQQNTFNHYILATTAPDLVSPAEVEKAREAIREAGGMVNFINCYQRALSAAVEAIEGGADAGQG